MPYDRVAGDLEEWLEGQSQEGPNSGSGNWAVSKVSPLGDLATVVEIVSLSRGLQPIVESVMLSNAQQALAKGGKFVGERCQFYPSSTDQDDSFSGSLSAASDWDL